MVTAFLLHHHGRIWWCACGKATPWSGDIWTSHNSQHLFDPYSFSHVLHGVIFCGLFALLLRKASSQWRFFFSIVLECAWELFENSPFIIQRYREGTFALGYEGDSVLNSMGDVMSCGIGFAVAYYLGLRRSLVFVAIVELVMLVWIRDNLTLNIIMLIHPIDAIKAWQMGQ